MDRVETVTQTASLTATTFAYAPDGGRYRQVVTGPAEGYTEGAQVPDIVLASLEPPSTPSEIPDP